MGSKQILPLSVPGFYLSPSAQFDLWAACGMLASVLSASWHPATISQASKSKSLPQHGSALQNNSWSFLLHASRPRVSGADLCCSSNICSHAWQSLLKPHLKLLLTNVTPAARILGQKQKRCDETLNEERGINESVMSQHHSILFFFFSLRGAQQLRGIRALWSSKSSKRWALLQQAAVSHSYRERVGEERGQRQHGKDHLHCCLGCGFSAGCSVSLSGSLQA